MEGDWLRIHKVQRALKASLHQMEEGGEAIGDDGYRDGNIENLSEPSLVGGDLVYLQDHSTVHLYVMILARRFLSSPKAKFSGSVIRALIASA